MQVNGIDHIVLTVKDIEAASDFYSSVLGMQPVVFGEHRHALLFGSQKINLHQLHHEFEPKAEHVAAGSADLCFIIETPIKEAICELRGKGVTIFEGPVRRTGAQGAILSVYIHDPDGNLIELSNYNGD